MTENVKKYLNAITGAGAGAVFEPSHIGGVKGYKAQLPSQKPYELVMRYRLELQNLGMSIFVGDSAPCNPTTIEDILSQIQLTGKIEADETWEELWITPILMLPEILKIISTLGFPQGLKNSIPKTKEEVLIACSEFLQELNKSSKLDIILLKPTICIFGFVEPKTFEESLKIAKRSLCLSSEYFDMGPSQNYVAKAWAKDGIFGIGCA